MTRQRRQRLDHLGGEPGFRKGLAATQRQRDCTARQIGKTMRHEYLARHVFQRPQKSEILDAPRTEIHEKRRLVLRLDRLFLQSGRRLFEGHRESGLDQRNTSARRVSAGSSVKSSFSGVTEILFCAKAARSVPCSGVELRVVNV